MNVRVARIAAVAAALLPIVVPTAAHASYADRIRATPGLEWYLPLDETTGRVHIDAVSGENTGFAGSRVALDQPGALAEPGNRAVRFLGGGSNAKSESRIALSTWPTDDGKRPYSFEAWVQVERTDNRSLRIYSDEDYMGGMLVAARDGQLVFSRYDSGLRFGAYPPDYLYGVYPMAPKRATTLSAPVTLGVWTHVVATYDGERMRLFTDGVERASAPSTFTVSHEGMVYGGQAELGVRSALFFDRRFWLEFRGSIDEPALYRRALTPCEIMDHHRSAVAPPSYNSGQITVCGDVPPTNG